MLESGEYSASAELAKAEKINDSYLSRILRLTLVAPDIIEAILTGHQPGTLQLDDFLKPLAGRHGLSNIPCCLLLPRFPKLNKPKPACPSRRLNRVMLT